MGDDELRGYLDAGRDVESILGESGICAGVQDVELGFELVAIEGKLVVAEPYAPHVDAEEAEPDYGLEDAEEPVYGRDVVLEVGGEVVAVLVGFCAAWLGG